MAKEDTKAVKAEKKAPAKKAAAPKKEATPKAKTEKKVPAKKKAPSGKTVTVTQVRSPLGRGDAQMQTLIGLGLNKMNRTSTLEDTPAVRGMIRKVNHLVKVEEAA